MADISRELAAIRNAVYGEEVRGSIIAALEKINEDSESGGETVDIDADDLGLVQNEITEYVYPTYKGTASSHGIRISGGGESSSDYIFYYIFYYNYDGSELLHIDVVDKGEDGDYDGTPERPSSGKNAYTFIGWSTSKNATTAEADCTKNVTEDKQVYGAYTVTVSSVELKYYNYDGSQLLNTETVAYGGDGTYSATPARASTAQYDYTFVGWSTNTNATSATANATKNLTADKSVYAAYSRATKTYVLTYYNYNGGSSLYTEILPYGKNGTYSGTPTRASTAQYTYTFIGWSTTKNATTVDANATKNLTSDRSVYAVYSQQTRTYSLKYYNYDGTSLLNTDTVAYGGNGTYSGTPSRASDSQYSYTFAGWSTSKNATSATANATQNITSDKSVYAAYSRQAVTVSHTLNYYNYDGTTLLNSETVADGGNGTYSGTPTRASTAQYSYTFAGWSTYANSSIADSSATKNITADKNVYAAYTQTTRTYSLKYYNYDGTSLLNTDTVAYGGNGTYSRTPTREADSQYTYTFVGWSTSKNATSATTNATRNITADKNVYAAYTQTTRTYSLKYYNYDGSQLLNTETVAYGGDGTYTGTPSRASTAQYTYTFVGWSTSMNASTATANATKNITADKSVYAAYTQTTRTYSLKYYNYDGTSLLNTDTVAYGGDGTYAGTPSRASTAQYTYTFVGWSTSANSSTATTNATKNITADKSVYAAYTQTTRTYSLKYYNYDGTTLLNTDTVAYGGDGTYTGTPSRAADSQYSYTFVGWSTSTNASTATTNATKNITADKSVYAAYTAEAIAPKLSRISAAFKDVEYKIYEGDSLDSIKNYLIVSAIYEDETTVTLENMDYSLSGSLSLGQSRITVSYGEKSTFVYVYVFEELYTIPQNAIEMTEVTENISANGSNIIKVMFDDVADLNVTTYDEYRNSYYTICDVAYEGGPLTIEVLYLPNASNATYPYLSNGVNSFKGYRLKKWSTSTSEREGIYTYVENVSDSPVEATIKVYAVPIDTDTSVDDQGEIELGGN